MQAPAQIFVPDLYAGQPAALSWSPVEGAEAYLLGRALDGADTYSVLYEGTGTTFSDLLPVEAQSVTYRVAAFTPRTATWQEYDAADRTWETLDSLDWTWAATSSPYTYSAELLVTPNRPPVISGDDQDLGLRYRGFRVAFSATDPDPNNTVGIVATLDASIRFENPNIQQGAVYEIEITDNDLFAMEDGSAHTIQITATDNLGAASSRTVTFISVEDLSATAVYYVLRDDLPVARITSATQWLDYLAVGRHRYKIRAIDRYDTFTDSNEIEIEIIVPACTLAPAGTPAEYLELSMRRGEHPQRSRSSGIVYSEARYEGRRYPVYNATTQRSIGQTIALSTRTQQEHDRLDAIINDGGVLVYRDCYDTRVIGVIPQLDGDYHRRSRAGRPISFVADYTFTIHQCDYEEGVPYD